MPHLSITFRTAGPGRSRRGLQMVEVAVASVVVATLLVAALNLLSATMRGAKVASQISLGDQLAVSMMEEIQGHTYGWPASVLDSTRESFQSVADYGQWRASPPVDLKGSPIADASWERSVAVRPLIADGNRLVEASTADTGCLKVTVTVKRNGKTVRELSSLRCEVWDNVQDLSDESARHVDAINQPPVVVIQRAGPLTGTAPLDVDFDVSDSFDPDGDSMSYAWNFGDGSTASGGVVTHTYTNTTGGPIERTARLTISDTFGAATTKSFHVFIDYP